jgi:hypothetical protein
MKLAGRPGKTKLSEPETLKRDTKIRRLYFQDKLTLVQLRERFGLCQEKLRKILKEKK